MGADREEDVRIDIVWSREKERESRKEEIEGVRKREKEGVRKRERERRERKRRGEEIERQSTTGVV